MVGTAGAGGTRKEAAARPGQEALTTQGTGAAGWAFAGSKGGRSRYSAEE